MKSEVRKKEIVIIGDSWSEDFAVRGFRTWPWFLQQETGWIIHNYSMGGSLVTGEEPVWDLDGNLLGEVKACEEDDSYYPAAVDLVVLEGGINDFRHGIDADRIVKAMERYKERLQKRFSQADFLCLLNYQSMATEDLMKQLTMLERGIAAFMPCFSMAGWIPPGFWNTEDYIHPSEAGYRLLMKNILSVLDGELPQCFPSVLEAEFRRNVLDFCRVEFSCKEGRDGRLVSEVCILEESGKGRLAFQGLSFLCTGDRICCMEESGKEIRIPVHGHLWCFSSLGLTGSEGCSDYFIDEAGQLKSFLFRL